MGKWGYPGSGNFTDSMCFTFTNYVVIVGIGVIVELCIVDFHAVEFQDNASVIGPIITFLRGQILIDT